MKGFSYKGEPLLDRPVPDLLLSLMVFSFVPRHRDPPDGPNMGADTVFLSPRWVFRFRSHRRGCRWRYSCCFFSFLPITHLLHTTTPGSTVSALGEITVSCLRSLPISSACRCIKNVDCPTCRTKAGPWVLR